jgi:hypothetical protein
MEKIKTGNKIPAITLTHKNYTPMKFVNKWVQIIQIKAVNCQFSNGLKWVLYAIT